MMPENIKDIAYLLFVIPIVGLFAHIVPVLALYPILSFVWAPKRGWGEWLALLVGTPILWAMLFYGSYTAGQFFKAPSIIGLLVGAGISTVLMAWGIGKKWFDNREWVPMVMLFGLPTVGYFIGLTLGS